LLIINNRTPAVRLARHPNSNAIHNAHTRAQGADPCQPQDSFGKRFLGAAAAASPPQP